MEKAMQLAGMNCSALVLYCTFVGIFSNNPSTFIISYAFLGGQKKVSLNAQAAEQYTSFVHHPEFILNIPWPSKHTVASLLVHMTEIKAVN